MKEPIEPTLPATATEAPADTMQAAAAQAFEQAGTAANAPAHQADPNAIPSGMFEHRAARPQFMAGAE